MFTRTVICTLIQLYVYLFLCSRMYILIQSYVHLYSICTLVQYMYTCTVYVHFYGLYVHLYSLKYTCTVLSTLVHFYGMICTIVVLFTITIVVLCTIVQSYGTILLSYVHLYSHMVKVYCKNNNTYICIYII